MCNDRCSQDLENVSMLHVPRYWHVMFRRTELHVTRRLRIDAFQFNQSCSSFADAAAVDWLALYSRPSSCAVTCRHSAEDDLFVPRKGTALIGGCCHECCDDSRKQLHTGRLGGPVTELTQSASFLETRENQSCSWRCQMTPDDSMHAYT